MTAALPAMSVVLTTRGPASIIGHTLAALARQESAASLEVVIITDSATASAIDPESLRAFWGHQIIAVPAVHSVGEGNAEGVRAARAPVVALAEDHCFPQPGWAEALLARHAEGWDVVGPLMINANPATRLARADFLMGYAPWATPSAAGASDMLPGHNSSYKRHLLLAEGDALGQALRAEWIMHLRWRAQGRRLYMEPAARAAHQNFARWGGWAYAQVFNGWLMGTRRSATLTPLRRAGYGLASPLIALRRAPRMRHAMRRIGLTLRKRLALWPALSLALALDALGQGFGFLFGRRSPLFTSEHCEFDRGRFLTDHDRAQTSRWTGGAPLATPGTPQPDAPACRPVVAPAPRAAASTP